MEVVESLEGGYVRMFFEKQSRKSIYEIFTDEGGRIFRGQFDSARVHKPSILKTSQKAIEDWEKKHDTTN